MKVLPIINSNNSMSYKGHVSPKTAELCKSMGDGWIKAATSGKYTTLPIINTCLFNSQRVGDVFLNLSTIMERFCHACELTFEKSPKTGTHRFFIENNYSNYKVMCGDIDFSPAKSKMHDIDYLEKLEKQVAKLNPYEENSKFIIQRKPENGHFIYDKEFIPDEDYIFLEDKLIVRDKTEATMEDIKEFLEAAKKEGFAING